jgi:hypothetical protein
MMRESRSAMLIRGWLGDLCHAVDTPALPGG